MELNKQFSEVIGLIHQARNNALKMVNIELINLYWKIGEHISKRIESAEWGQSVVQQLAEYLQQNEPDLKGFSDKNLWRMKQFFETYNDHPKLSPLVRELSWTNNLIIFARTKTIEEKEFYLKICKEEQYSKRELERQISAGLFEPRLCIRIIKRET
jgi:predicted nuclease of restriction endonuclease-like (RecB) superfamily